MMTIREMALDESLDRKTLPPKIQRAIMLWIHILHVTPYAMILSRRGENGIRWAQREIAILVEKSRYGVVVRSVPRDHGVSGMKLPYDWFRAPEEVSFERVRKLVKSPWMMAFSPQATPDCMGGFIVGRWTHNFGNAKSLGGEKIEFVTNEIRPRTIEKASMDDPRFGWVCREPGRFYRQGSGRNLDVCKRLVQALAPYEKGVRTLVQELERQRGVLEIVCEFTWNSRTGRVEFHDFDCAERVS